MLNKRSGFIMLIMTFIVMSSCKKEFTEIGINLVGEPRFEGKLFENSMVRVYDKEVPKVFSMGAPGLAPKTNLPVASLGIYHDPVLGNLEADMVTTIEPDMAVFSKDLGDNTKILGAQLVIPYFSHTLTQNGNTDYVLDSIFGNQDFEIKIKELNYLLPTYDPDENLETPQYFYSDFDFSPFATAQIADTIDFNISPQPYITYKRNEDGTFELDDNGDRIVKDSLAPHIVIKLDTTYFRQKIFDHSGEDVLTSTEKFKDYFRGLYIDAIAGNGNGLLMQLPLNQAKVLIQYTYDETDDNGTPDDPSDDTVATKYKEIKMKLGKYSVNTYQNVWSGYAQNALNTSDLINGDEQVLVKGEAGAETVVQLFNEQQLRELRLKNWLINNANLYFYVDENASQDLLSQPKRLILYNYDDQKSLPDIYAPENNADNNYEIFDGNLQTDDQGRKYYKFGITRHIRNVLRKDSTNVKLGLRVCSQISLPLKTGDVFRDPDAYNPKGTILFGNQTTNGTPPVLKIYYTEPK